MSPFSAQEAAAIRAEATARGVTRLCHFTWARTLPRILRDPRGVLCVADVRRETPELLDCNDEVRRDGKLDYVNCSIEYPNAWMLRKIKDKYPLFPDLVVLLLDPSLLWDTEALFSENNAAAYGANPSSGVERFRTLFGPLVADSRGRRFPRQARMLPCCPTNDQAEVLIPRNVPREKIIGVAVPTTERAQVESARLALIPDVEPVQWIVAPDLFTTTWSSAVRAGERPREAVFEEER